MLLSWLKTPPRPDEIRALDVSSNAVSGYAAHPSETGPAAWRSDYRIEVDAVDSNPR